MAWELVAGGNNQPARKVYGKVALVRIVLGMVMMIEVLLMGSCNSRAGAIPAMIHADPDDVRAAMRAAPVVLLVRIGDTTLTGDEQMVDKPPGVAGPGVPAIPLHLARIRAEVLLTVQGQERASVEFYSWIWASGQHGGPRLFRPTPGAIRVVFLREDGGYLHTVGDYPHYDLELKPGWVPAIVTGWKSGPPNGKDAMDRLASLLIRAEFEGLTEAQLREDFGEDGPQVNHYWGGGLYDLIGLVGPLLVVRELDDMCLHSKNPPSRFAACFVTAQYFPRRCAGYRLARESVQNGPGEKFLARHIATCGTTEQLDIQAILTGEVPPYWWAKLDARHGRETLQVFASGMDEELRRAACAVAATRAEWRDIAECGGATATKRTF